MSLTIENEMKTEFYDEVVDIEVKDVVCEADSIF